VAVVTVVPVAAVVVPPAFGSSPKLAGAPFAFVAGRSGVGTGITTCAPLSKAGVVDTLLAAVVVWPFRLVPDTGTAAAELVAVPAAVAVAPPACMPAFGTSPKPAGAPLALVAGRSGVGTGIVVTVWFVVELPFTVA